MICEVQSSCPSSPSHLFPPLPSSLLQEISDAPFYSDKAEESEDDEDSDDEDEDEDEEKEKKKKKKPKKKPYIMDNDHRLLLRNSKPLLQSRSAAVSPSPSLNLSPSPFSQPVSCDLCCTGCDGCGSDVSPYRTSQ